MCLATSFFSVPLSFSIFKQDRHTPLSGPAGHVSSETIGKGRPRFILLINAIKYVSFLFSDNSIYNLFSSIYILSIMLSAFCPFACNQRP